MVFTAKNSAALGYISEF